MSLNGSDLPSTSSKFERRLTIVTMSLLLVVLVIYLLQLFADLLKPLLIAVLVAYAILPIHRWLVRRGLRSSLAYIVILSMLLAIFIGVGRSIDSSIESLTSDRLSGYRERLEGVIVHAAQTFGGQESESAKEHIQKALKAIAMPNDELFRRLGVVAGTFVGYVTFALIVFVYLVFLMAEKLTFPRRLTKAFGEQRSGQVQTIIANINEAIVRYIAVKAWISLITALLSLAVFLAFGIDFAFLWSILIFLLNFIPYLGGLVAMAPPVALGFLQHETFLPGIAIVVLLTAIQLFTGQFVEPRVAGQRLNLSPLLIILALGFWGSLWGIGGMLLAVPLTVVMKIVLDQIPETRPIGTLMSNM
jgi:predicted PurR-regulated permease PerM